MRERILLLALMLILPLTAFAWYDGWDGGYDFEVDNIYYEIVSETPSKVRVCSKSWGGVDVSSVIMYSSDYHGNLVIPSEVTYNEVTYVVSALCWNAFLGCSELESITIPSSITNITATDYYCYYEGGYGHLQYGSNGIKSIKVVEGNPVFDSRNDCNAIIETATNRLISGCDNTVIPNSVTSIGTSAFVNCKELTNICLPNGITEIGKSAFAGCSNLSVIEVPNSVTSIGSFAFWETGLTEFVFPNSISSIESGIFCSTPLISIEIPNSVTTIGSTAFAGCTELTKIDIPNSVISINWEAFYGCSGLTSIIIPASVTQIGSYTFCGTNLLDIVCEALTPPSISYTSNNYNVQNTFDCYNRATLYVPRKSYDVYRNTNGWKQFRNIQSLADLEIDNLYYNVTSDSTVCLTYKSENLNSYIGDVVIPESVNYDGKDYVVNAIDDKAFYNCSGLTSITIPNTITTIGNYAFYGCSGLVSIDIPNSDITIGAYAFCNCTGLLNVNIPDSLSTIGIGSFLGCTGLTSLTIGKSVASIGNVAFSDCYNLKELTWNAKNCTSNGSMSTSNIENVTIGSEVVILPEEFLFGSKITEVSIPNSVTAISNSAFYGCTDLKSITIPNSVTAIGNSAFYGCADLKSITIPNSVNTIGGSAFYGCYKLISVIIPNSVTSIGDKAFYGCGALCAIEIPNSVASIGNYVFQYCNNLKTITIPNSVSSIGNYAFYGCSGMMSVDIPSSVTTIGSNAFYNCNALSKVTISDVAAWCNIIFEDNTANPLYYSHHLYLNNQEIKHLDIPDGVTAINNYAFINGTSFIDLSFPYTLESIGTSAFEGCKRLTNVSMGLSVTVIGPSAFRDCTAISSVTCMAPTPPTMAAFNCFDNDCYDWASLYVPGDKVDEYKSTTYWNKFANTFGTGIEVDGLYYLFDPDKRETTVTYKDENYCSYTGEVTIPETVNYGGLEYTVTGIGKASFAYCDELTSVGIPNTVTSIGDYAFMYCEGLTSITIPNSVTSIGDNSFDGCGAICAIEIPNSVSSIGSMGFQGCTSLTDIMIGSDVTSIGTKAFNYCNSLHSVTCMGSVPPLMDNSDCFTSYGYNATLKVPQTSIDDYQSSNYWYKFAVIEGFNLSEPGDVNGDGGINISDVTALIDLLLSGGETSAGADVNGDDQVNISDVTALIDRLLSGN